MKPGELSEAQIRAILREAKKTEESGVAFCRAHGISRTTFWRWCKKYGDSLESEEEYLRAEIARFERLLAERELEIGRLKEALAKNEVDQDETEAWFAT
jgi:hypothetical protein